MAKAVEWRPRGVVHGGRYGQESPAGRYLPLDAAGGQAGRDLETAVLECGADAAKAVAAAESFLLARLPPPTGPFSPPGGAGRGGRGRI